jgi:hypothetical protein
MSSCANRSAAIDTAFSSGFSPGFLKSTFWITPDSFPNHSLYLMSMSSVLRKLSSNHSGIGGWFATFEELAEVVAAVLVTEEIEVEFAGSVEPALELGLVEVHLVCHPWVADDVLGLWPSPGRRSSAAPPRGRRSG